MTALQNAIAKLGDLLRLPEGWNYGVGKPLSVKAYTQGFLVLHHLNSVNANRFDVLPSDDGGAAIMASQEDSLAEIIARGDGRFDLFLENGQDEPKEFENIDFGSLTSILEDEGWQSLKSSGSRTHVFIVKSTEDSPAQLFETTAWVRPLSKQDALIWRAHRFATTSTNTTQDSEECLLFSGGSQQPPLVLAQG